MKPTPSDKKKGITPVILIQQQPDLSNTILIGQMLTGGKENSTSAKPSSNIFSGGFKYRPEESSKVKVEPNPSKINASQMDKFTVYDEFGIINDSIGHKKYRQNPKQPDINNAPIVTNSNMRNMSQNNPWKRETSQNNYVNPNYYQISKLKQRQQTAIHVKSSLQEINLQNIQAKLEAHRSSMKSIEEQYNMSRGKASVRVENQSRQKLRFNVDVDKEYRNMQPQKVYQIIKDSQQQMDRPKEQVLLEELWEEKKKNDPKLAQYDFKYQQFRVEKDAKKMIGGVLKSNLYSWDKFAKNEDLQRRKVAKIHKSKEREYGQQVESKYISKLYGQSSISPTKQAEQFPESEPVDIQQRIASKDDKFIGKFIMAEIDVDKRGTISKDELVEYLSTKDHLIKGYHIDLKWLHTDLDNFQTKRKGMLNQQQIIHFLATLDSLHHPNMVLKEVSKAGKPTVSAPLQDQKSNKLYKLNFKDHQKRFLQLFNLIDINDDRIIKREQYIQNIFLDADCTKILDKPAIKFNIIDKSVSFRQILSFVLDDYRKQRNQKLKKSKQYISFERFKEYFELPQTLDLKMFDTSQNEKLKKERSSAEVQMFDIDEQYLMTLKDIFDAIPRVYQDYIVATDFVSIALKDPQVLAVSDDICRIQSYETKLPVETIMSTLGRMGKEVDQYATWDILKTYLSRRGRPLDWDYQLIQKKKQLRKSKLNIGADFATTKLGSNIRRQNESSIKKDPFSDTIQSQAIRGASRDRYTVPKPFKITDEMVKEKIKSKELTSEQKQIEEMKKKFKAKPVNKEILESNPDLILGKVAKTQEKSFVYNYENYQNDRIQRVLKKAQNQFEEALRIKQIKKMTEVKAKNIKVDLSKKLDDVLQEQKKNKSKIKPKPTVPSVSSNLYPENPKEQGAKKIQKIKKNLQKMSEAERMKQQQLKDMKQRAKQKNQNVKKASQQQKKKEQQQKRERQNLIKDSFKPKVNKYQPTEAEKQANRVSKQQRQKKKLQNVEKVMSEENMKKQKRMQYEKKEKKLDIAGLQDEEILDRFDEVDFQELLLDQGDKAMFRKEFGFKDKTRKEIKQRYRGVAMRQRTAMQTEDKRLAQEKRKLKQQKQGKIVKQKIDAARQKKDQITSTLNMQTEFHRSKALRRYRVLIQGKQPPSQFDSYSHMGDP